MPSFDAAGWELVAGETRRAWFDGAFPGEHSPVRTRTGDYDGSAADMIAYADRPEENLRGALRAAGTYSTRLGVGRDAQGSP